MNVGKILGSNFVKSTVCFVKKHPTVTTLGIGAAALIGYKAATMPRKQVRDFSNYLILSNPYFNPFGWWQHIVPSDSVTVNKLDGPIVEEFVNRNNKLYQDYYDNLSNVEKTQEFYKNGGKGVRFNEMA